MSNSVPITRSTKSQGTAKAPATSKHNRSAKFPKTPGLTNILRSATVHQKAYEHQKLVLNYAGTLTLSKKARSKATPARRKAPIKAGDPVKFTWSINDNKAVFVGYVYSVKTSSTPKVTTTRIVCIGSSKAFRTTRKRIFRNNTVGGVVNKIAKEGRLKAVVHPTSHRHPQITQPGLTDWQMLRQLAAKTGFGLFVNGVTLYFIDQDIWTTKKIPSSRIFKYTTRAITLPLILEQNMYAWKATVPEDSASIGDGGDVDLTADEETVELTEDIGYMDETSDEGELFELDQVDVADEYLETYDLVETTTADDLVDTTPAEIIEEA